MSVLQRKNERAQQVNISACISCYLGVTEPALFGVNMRYGFPLICGMVGSACAAVISIGTGVEAFSIGVGGLPGILSIKPEFWVQFLIAMAAAIVIPFVLTLLIGARKLSAADRGREVQGTAVPVVEAAALPEETPQPESTAAEAPAAKEGDIVAPLSGRILPLAEIPDEVFSQGVLGDGVGIDPTSNVVLAPADASVSSVIEDSRHACGLALDNGIELLIHVGIDTVSMGGDGFELHVKEGDRVRRGDPLITFDLDKIRAAGHPTVTAFLVTEPGDASIDFHTGIDAAAGETVVMHYSGVQS